MARARSRKALVLVHWHAEESMQMAGSLRELGWNVGVGLPELRDLRAKPPFAVLISLRRLPSHGREVADAIWYTQWGREIPILFIDGAPEKVAATRRKFPGAGYCAWEQLSERLAGLPARPSGPKPTSSRARSESAAARSKTRRRTRTL